MKETRIISILAWMLILIFASLLIFGCSSVIKCPTYIGTRYHIRSGNGLKYKKLQAHYNDHCKMNECLKIHCIKHNQNINGTKK